VDGHARREFHEALKIGQRLAAGPVAIIAKLYQIETDVLERLPGMTNQDELSVLLPSNWQPHTAANKPLRETCPA
jgi:hypothetical protein